MCEYFTANNNKRLIHVSKDLLDNYNNRYRRSIEITPVQATENPGKAWDNLYSSKQSKNVPKFDEEEF